MDQAKQREKDAKERQKMEKLRAENERKEREKREKEQKELEKKEKKLLKKGGGSGGVPPSATTSALSNFARTDSSNPSAGQQIPNSKSETFLNQPKKVASSTSQKDVTSKNRLRCQIIYLDESVKIFNVEKSATGEDLMSIVAEDLELVEKEYFSLTYRDVNNMKFWLDHEKKIKNQLKGNVSTLEAIFHFEVKFYPPEPSVLQEEITRYLLTLQLRHDIMDGKLPCTFVTHALLGAFTVQAELGDYDEANSGGFSYLEGFCFAPNQTPELLEAIAEYHKNAKGQTPAEAEMHYLENAVKLAMYGVDLHNAKDSDGIDILIGVSASGLLVFRDHLRINRFAWPKILKISYKRNHFYLKLRPGEFEKYETTIGFRCPNHKAAKRLWKIAVEHHAFFRLKEPEKPNKSRILPTFNSNFRYTGHSTYLQSRNRSIDRSQPQFTRSLSKRLTQSMDRGLAGQNPNDTPVQTAAINHFNRTKPHMSTSNIPGGRINRQDSDLRESQEELDQGGDYIVNNTPSYNANLSPRQQQQPQPVAPVRIQGPGFNSGRPQPSSRLNSYEADQQQQQQQPPANFSNRSNLTADPNSSRTGSYQGQKKSVTLPNFGQAQQQSNLPDINSLEQLDEQYYTSLDKSNDPSRTPTTPSRLQNDGRLISPIAGSGQPPQQRYVPNPSRPVAAYGAGEQLRVQDPNQFPNMGGSPVTSSPRPNTSYTSRQNPDETLDDSVFLPETPQAATANEPRRFSSNPANSILINQNRPFSYEAQEPASSSGGSGSGLGPGASGLAVPPKPASLAQKVLVKNQNALNVNYSDNSGAQFETFGSGGRRGSGGPPQQQQQQQQTFKGPRPATLPKPVLVAKPNPEAVNAQPSPAGYDPRFQGAPQQQQQQQRQPQQQQQQAVHSTRFDRTPIQPAAESEPVVFGKPQILGSNQGTPVSSYREPQYQTIGTTSTPPQPLSRATTTSRYTNSTTTRVTTGAPEPATSARYQPQNLRYDYQQQQYMEQEAESQRQLIEQKEMQQIQEKQAHYQKIQQLQEQKRQQSPQVGQKLPGGYQAQNLDTSRTSSISSAPDTTIRVKKQIIVSEGNQTNHLLRAIQMATDLDPNFEVENVEIKND